MDGLMLFTALAVALAVFAGVNALQSLMSSTRTAVQARVVGAADKLEHGPSLHVPRLQVLSERSRRMAFDLERAGLAFTVTEYLLIRVACGVAVAFLSALVVARLAVEATPGLLVAVIAFFVGYQLPTLYLGQRRAARQRRIEDQLLDALVSMAKSMRAGVGLTQALEYAARETDAPLGPELIRVVRELQLGADLELIFEELNNRVGSPDLEIASTAIIIQRRVGGNLSEILTNVANTIRERKAIRSELHALSAKQRLQGNLSALIPVGVAILFFLANPELAGKLVNTTTGLIALAVGIFFEILGLWLVRKFAQIEV
ncbi:MAG TPA: type II secretion system F family protein [Dehalococcoidia bacterium]|nr:type II secretion system F family protein [Dehalococcoidia bacterium]